ncbi:MAG: DM13 domain-containing protein [Cyanobacteria bacterium J06621_8]
MSSLVVIGVSSSQVSSSPLQELDENVTQQLTIKGKGSQKVTMTGTFETTAAPTSGKAKIIEENGVRYLEISSSFSTTEQAPDLHVLLDTVSQPPEEYDSSNSGRYVNLGSLQNTMGEQRYPIPDSVNLADQKSVVVHCRMANKTMGFASLEESKTALAE